MMTSSSQRQQQKSMQGKQQQQAEPYNTDPTLECYIPPPPPHSFISSAGHASTSTTAIATGTGPGNTIAPFGISTNATGQSLPPPPSITVAGPPPPSNSRNGDGGRTVDPASSALSSPSFDSSSSCPASGPARVPYSESSAQGNRHLLSYRTSSSSSSSSYSPMTTKIATGTTTTSTSSTFTTTVSSTTALPPPSSSSTLLPAGDQTQAGENSLSYNPRSMTIEEYQWQQGAGSFPESLDTAIGRNRNGSTRTTRSSTSASGGSNGHGYDSTSTSQRSSHEGASRGGVDTTGPCQDDEFGTHISFVFANEKRFSDFHSLFRSVPDDEKLIEDYGCALQKEILVQGRLYISENHVCFNANIFGWVTNLVIAFSEITAIEKRLTAFVIPNAISIVTTTNTKGHFFASFLSRDAAHDLLMAAWRKSFPCAANASVGISGSGDSKGNGFHRQNRSNLGINDDDQDSNNDAQSFISARGGGSSESRRNRHRRSFSNASQNWTGDESNGREDWGEDDDGKSNTEVQRRGSKRAVVRKLIKDVIAPIIPDDDQNSKSLSPSNSGNNKKSGRVRSVSELPPRPTSFDAPRDRDSIGATRSSLEDDSLTPPAVQRPRAGTESLPNPRSGTAALSTTSKSRAPPSSSLIAGSAPRTGPTTCKCSKDGRHYANLFLSETYSGTVQAMWKLLFDSDFSKGFLTSEAMKGADVQEESWQISVGNTSTKTTRYTKWLGMPIGPKTTKAVLTDVCEYKNFDDYVTTVTTTSTPDVPSGGSFTTKVRTCITWAGSGQVQVIVTGGVEFTKSSWIKGQIEKGAAEGLTTHYKELNRCIRKHIASNPKGFVGTGTGSNGSSKTADTGSAGATIASSSGDRDSRKEGPQASTVASSSLPIPAQEPWAPMTSAIASPATGGSTSVTDFWSALAKAMEWNHGAASHLTLLGVLVVVMVANIWIWLQISSVSTQIEKIQSDILFAKDGYDHGHHLSYHGYNPLDHASSPSAQRAPPPAGSGKWPQGQQQRRREMNEFERDELFAMEQEEAMWAWLTERESRHRQYKRSSGVIPGRHLHHPQHPSSEPGENSEATRVQKKQNANTRLTQTEMKFQSRIDDLQEQLAALERQASLIKVEARAAERDQDATLS